MRPLCCDQADSLAHGCYYPHVKWLIRGCHDGNQRATSSQRAATRIKNIADLTSLSACLAHNIGRPVCSVFVVL